MDELIESIIVNKHTPKEKPKELGPVDRLVKEAYDKALEENKDAIVEEKKKKVEE